MKSIYITIGLFLVFSKSFCQENEFQEYYNSCMNDIFEIGEFYEAAIEIEELLISSKLLTDPTDSSYHSLIDHLNNKEIDILRVKDFKEKVIISTSIDEGLKYGFAGDFQACFYNRIIETATPLKSVSYMQLVGVKSNQSNIYETCKFLIQVASKQDKFIYFEHRLLVLAYLFTELVHY